MLKYEKLNFSNTFLNRKTMKFLLFSGIYLFSGYIFTFRRRRFLVKALHTLQKPLNIFVNFFSSFFKKEPLVERARVCVARAR